MSHHTMESEHKPHPTQRPSSTEGAPLYHSKTLPCTACNNTHVHKIRIKPSPRPIQTYQHSFILNSYCTFDHNTPPGGVRHLRRKVEGDDHRYTPAGVGLNNTTGIIFNIFSGNTNLDPFASRFHKKKVNTLTDTLQSGKKMKFVKISNLCVGNLDTLRICKYKVYSATILYVASCWDAVYEDALKAAGDAWSRSVEGRKKTEFD